MFVDVSHAYFIFTLPFTVLWAALFIFKKKTRREQLVMSVVGMFLGPITEILHFQDYWMPQSIASIRIGSFQLMVEDLIFGFVFGGLAAVMYEDFIGVHLAKPSRKFHIVISALPIVAIGFFFTTVLFVVGLNSIFAVSGGLCIIALFIVLERRDLLYDSILSGFFVAFILGVFYFAAEHLVTNMEELFNHVWFLQETSLGVRFAGVPMTEMVWAFAWGFACGPLYVFMKGLVLKKDN